MFLQGSASGSSFSFPPGQCIGGVSSDSSCALSLLSNQTWSSRNQSSSTGLGNSMNIDGAPVSHSAAGHSVTVAHLPSSSSPWGFKANDDPNCGLHTVPSGHLGLGQISQPHFSSQYHHGDLMMDQVHDGGRQYMDVDHSRAYNSATTHHVDWSLWLFFPLLHTERKSMFPFFYRILKLFFWVCNSLMTSCNCCLHRWLFCHGTELMLCRACGIFHFPG